MSSIKHVVIAAAGLGSRLGHGLPKCLVEIEGKTLLERQLALFNDIPDVRIVVGYMEHAVMEAVSRLDRSVIIVRNPDFRTTTTQDSYALGAAGIDGKCVFLDADIVFDAESLETFLAKAAHEPLAIGVTHTKTDDAVFVEVEESAEGQMTVLGFSREKHSRYEWANIVCAPGASFHRGRGPVFETLSEMLPATAIPVVSYEVDTEQDLQRAKAYLQAVDA